MFDLDNWDVNTDIEKDHELFVASVIADGEAKKARVMAFIQANNNSFDARDVANKFNLYWSLGKDFGNGICRVDFHSDETCRVKIMEDFAPINEWFR